MADPRATLLVLPQVEDSMLDMLFAYRKKCASDSPAGQLILPEGLRVLPLFTLCTHKMLALRPNAKVVFCSRVACSLELVVPVRGRVCASDD